MIGHGLVNYLDLKEICHNSNQHITCLLNLLVDYGIKGQLATDTLILQVRITNIFIFTLTSH